MYITNGHSSCKQMVQLLTEKLNARRPVLCFDYDLYGIL